MVKPRTRESAPRTFVVPAVFFGILLACGCTPRVEVAVPDKPIEININAKIDHEIRVKVEKDVEKLVDDKSDLF